MGDEFDFECGDPVVEEAVVVAGVIYLFPNGRQSRR